MLKKCRAKITRSPILAITLSLIMLLVAWQLINFWQFTRWQQTLLKKVAVVEVPKVEVEGKSKLKETKALPNKVKPLSLVQIDLPDLPALAPLPALPILQKNSSPVFPEEKAPKNKLINSPAKQQASSIQKIAIQTSTAKTTLKQKKNKKEPNTKNVAEMYQQLTSNNSIDIEIAWPNNNIERQNTFSFLYQCLGMKFGVLNGQQTNQPKVTLAKQPYKNQKNKNNSSTSTASSSQVSDWLRIAQGQLANQERDWLKKYNLSGTPVRLFPKAIDWQLAHLLTQQLNNVPLTSFRARYKYGNNSLMLTNIKLNGKLLVNNWTLITNKCSI